jgi:zinc transport system permease protein
LTDLLDDFMVPRFLPPWEPRWPVALWAALSCGDAWRILATRQRTPRSLAWPWRWGCLSGRTITPDSLLGVLSHGSLALGLVADSLMLDARVDLDAYLFGDILVVSRIDLAVIWGGAAIVCGVLVWRWQALLAEIVSNDLAYAAGLPPWRDRIMLILLIAAVVAVLIKLIGALLITAMLIIPAASARMIARGPEVMAALIGVVAAIGGLYAARPFGTPAGPSIICFASAIFCVASVVGQFRKA